MTAAIHKTIIEKGADFEIEVQVFDGATAKELSATTVVKMIIKKENDTGDIEYLKDDGTLTSPYSSTDHNFVGEVVPDDGSEVGSETYTNGNIVINIDKGITALFEPYLSENLDRFATEYNYFYTIDVTEGTDDMRVLRGKLAIRE